MGLFKKIFKGIGKVFKSVGKFIKKGFRAVGKFVNKLGIFGQIGLMALSMWAGPLLMAKLGPMLANFQTAALAGKFGTAVKVIATGAAKIAKAGSLVKSAVKGTFKSMGSVAKSAGNMIKTTFKAAGEKMGFNMSRVTAQTVGENLATLKSDVAANFWETGDILKGKGSFAQQEAMRKTILADAAAAPEVTSIDILKDTGTFGPQAARRSRTGKAALTAEKFTEKFTEKAIAEAAITPKITSISGTGDVSTATFGELETYDSLLQPTDFSKSTDFGLDKFTKSADPLDITAPSKVAYAQTPLSPTPENFPLFTKGTPSNIATSTALSSGITAGVTAAGMDAERVITPSGGTLFGADTPSIALQALGQGGVNAPIQDYLGEQQATYLNNHIISNPLDWNQNTYNSFMGFEAGNNMLQPKFASGY